MNRLAAAIKKAGYTVHNIDYPSRRYGVEYLCERYLAPVINGLPTDQPVHVVTHSLGGTLIRQYLQQHALPAGSRIAMLAPPNHGSEVADHLRHWKLFQWILGPTLQQLGTDSASVPNQFAPVAAEIGVIAGNRSVYPPLSWWINGKNDGLVSIESAKLEGMADFRVTPSGHGFIMCKPQVIQQLICFLDSGRFDK